MAHSAIAQNPEQLVDLVRVRMPYGKYKGRILADIPEAYLLWMAHKGFPKGRLGELLQLLLVIKENGLTYLLAPLRPKALHLADKR